MNNFWYLCNESDTVFLFVHGIFSDSQSCWLYSNSRQQKENQYWPDLVKEDKRLQSPSIFMAGYSTSLTSGDLTFKDAAQEIFDALQLVDSQGRQPPIQREKLIFICHSTGGIVIRYLLERHQDLFKDKAIGLVLIASPSLGSIYANHLNLLARFYNQQLGLQLQWGGENIEDLDDRFKDLVYSRRIPRLTGVEAYEHFFILRKQWLPKWIERWVPNRKKLVDKLSAGRYFGSPRLLPNTDHFSTVKPDGLDHPAHLLLLNFFDHFHQFLRDMAIPDIDSIISTLEKKYQKQVHEYQKREEGFLVREHNLRHLLKEAIYALGREQEESETGPKVQKALEKLKIGDTAVTEEIFREILDRKKQEGRLAYQEAAAAARHLGVMVSLHNPQEAVAVYQEAITLDPKNPESWNQLGRFLRIIGELKKSKEAYQKLLKLGERLEDPKIQAAGFNGLGNVYQTLGELDQAIKMYQQSLDINQTHGVKEGMAANYGNLGGIYADRGELNQAEEMCQKSLHLDNEVGVREYIASDYSNLGVIYRLRGELVRAKKMFKKSLDLNKAISSRVGLALNYHQLANLYRIRGELCRAKVLSQQSLKLNEDMGLKKGMAINYSELGIVYRLQKKLDRAAEMFQKSCELNKELGLQAALAGDYTNFGNLYGMRGQLDHAEGMHKKSLELNQRLELKGEMAGNYANLGAVYRLQGKLGWAEEMYQNSLRLNKEMGSLVGMATNYRHLGEVYQMRTEIEQAGIMYQKSWNLFREIGLNKNAEQVQDLLKNLNFRN